ncbi:unnamed protein product, partial [Darwinula stevensoni]
MGFVRNLSSAGTSISTFVRTVSQASQSNPEEEEDLSSNLPATHPHVASQPPKTRPHRGPPRVMESCTGMVGNISDWKGREGREKLAKEWRVNPDQKGEGRDKL